MTLMPPRLTAIEMQQAKQAGYPVPTQRRQIFGSMFSWFASTFRAGKSTFWPAAGQAKPPVNMVQSESGQTVSPASALTLSAVWACTWLLARTLATLPLDLKRYAANGKGKLLLDEALYEILRWKPNAKMTATNFWTFMWASVLLWGAGYAEKKYLNGKLIALEPLLPEYVTPFLTDRGQLRYRIEDPRNPREISADDMFRLMDKTLDGLTGCSVIEFGRNSMGIAQAGEQASSNTFRNGLQASGFIKVDKYLKTEQRDMFRKEVADFTGSEGKKRGGLMVLEGGTDFTALTIKPMDAQLLQSRQFSVEDVCRWFGVPPILIGHSVDGQTMWGSGVEQIFGGWTRLSLRPYLTACQQEIRSSLILPSNRHDTIAEYDLDELLAADSAARAALYSQLVQNGIATRNECREKEGLQAMDGGDVLTVQSNLMPITEIGKPTEQPAAVPPVDEQARDAAEKAIRRADAVAATLLQMREAALQKPTATDAPTKSTQQSARVIELRAGPQAPAVLNSRRVVERDEKGRIVAIREASADPMRKVTKIERDAKGLIANIVETLEEAS